MPQLIPGYPNAGTSSAGALAHRLPRPYWLLWSVLAAVPWLLPTRTNPWTTFWADALAAAIWLLLAVTLGFRLRKDHPTAGAAKGRSVEIDALPCMAASLALVAIVQAVLGRLTFPSEAVLYAGFLAAFAAAVVFGRYCPQLEDSGFVDALWTSLLIAAVLSAGIGMGQWLKVEPLGWLTPQADVDGRAIANVGQANHLATLICWGLIALWRARLLARIGVAVTSLAAAYLLFGLALTQSRTPWVAVLVVAAIAVVGRSTLGGRRALWALLGVLLVYVGSWLAMVHVSGQLELTPPRDTADKTSAGLRPTIWIIALEAIAERPWFGWGWNQFSVAWAHLAPGRLSIPGPNGYAHNLVLDLLIWNGIVIGAAVVAFLLWWLWRIVRTARSSEQWLLLAGVGVFGVHAMLELPHAYLLMLLPVAGMMGALSAGAQTHVWLRARRRWIGGMALLLAALLAAIVRDYAQIEARHQSLRIRDAGILALQPPPPVNTAVLRWMAEVYTVLEPRPAAELTSADAAKLRATATRVSSPGGLARYAQAAALQGDLDGAAWGLRTLCGLHRRPLCAAALTEWREFTSRHPSAAAVPLPPLPPK